MRLVKFIHYTVNGVLFETVCLSHEMMKQKKTSAMREAVIQKCSGNQILCKMWMSSASRKILCGRHEIYFKNLPAILKTFLAFWEQ